MVPEDGESFQGRRVDVALAGLIAAGTLVLLIATLRDYGMAWDEGFTVEREERLREWFLWVAGDTSRPARAWPPRLSKLDRRPAYLQHPGPQAGSPWRRETLRFYWQFAREEPNGHPPFYALLGLAGWAVSHRALPPPDSYRFGPAALFAATLGAVYYVMARQYGRAAGLAAALGLLTMPRVFAHAHLASYDVPTLCLWFLSAVALQRAAEPSQSNRATWAWTAALGVAWGCAMATKLTGWFVPLPLAAWALFHCDRRAARALVLGGAVAVLVVFALNPTWWAEPIGGVRAFLKSNLTRDQLRPIPTQFFGRVYRFGLPWYNTLTWTAVVVPPVTLALAVVGIGRIVAGRGRDRLGTLLLSCWAFLMLLRALPNAPGHDGVRQFLAAFVFLACLAGVGLAAVRAWFVRAAGPRAGLSLTAAALAVSVGAGACSTWRYHPLQLSYYNALIGGLSGAYRAGMEPTYYWDAVTPDVRRWLNQHTDPGRSVEFAYAAVTFEYLHRWGLLHPPPLSRRGQPPQWFIVMNRPGLLIFSSRSVSRFLLEHARPVFVQTLDVAPDVPLVAVFAGEDAFAANLILKRAAEEETGP